MKRLLTVLLAIASFLSMALAGDFDNASRGLIKRVTKGKSDFFEVAKIDAVNGKDVFEIESSGDKIILRGNTPVAVASGLNWYLKYYCLRQISWNSLEIEMPEVLPKVPEKVRIESPYKDRSYMNYCTFSYTAPFWDWDRWEKEIDWMALHGITMPLAVTGQEAVWYNTLLHYGMNDEEVRQFLVGPAFFAWQWMTNIEQWGGPLPKSWIDNSIELGQKILKRERELGMTPVLQAFTGFVPIKLTEKYPDADITVKPFWLRYFPPGTAQLDPLDPLFSKMGRTFMEEQEKLFGTNHLYAADPFHEGAPPKTYDGYLKQVGEKIFEVTAAVDPEAVIVMQSWSFRPDIAYAIPEDRLLVFDLNSSKAKGNEYFKGREWHGGVIHNFGGTVAMGGNLQTLLNRLCIEGKDETYGNYQGFGLFPEATENNPVLYELASEMAWHSKKPDLKQWVHEYADARYGRKDEDMLKAWDVMLKTVYGKGRGVQLVAESPICARPHLNVRGASPNSGLTSTKAYSFPELWQAPYHMLHADPAIRSGENYRYDLVDVMRQCLADMSILIQKRFAQAYMDNDRKQFDKYSALFMELILDTDELLATDPNFTLGRWIAQARACGSTPEEKSLYEKNARWLVTVWGPYDKNAMLFDYSNRQWSGLMKSFYHARWNMYLDFLKSEFDKQGDDRYVETKKIHHRFGRPSNEANDFYRKLSRWEYDWCDGTEKYPAEAVGDTHETALKLYRKWYATAEELYKEFAKDDKKPEEEQSKLIFGID